MSTTTLPVTTTLLVRYGIIPEVAKFQCDETVDFSRGSQVVISTHRGMQLGTIVEIIKPSDEPVARGVTSGVDQVEEDEDDSNIDDTQTFRVERMATSTDLSVHDALCQEADQAFSDWQQRIIDWKIDLQLIDLEWTLDREKLIMYVLNDRGNEPAKLALHAATEGLGTVEVQPVSAEGVVPQPAPGGGGGCGSGGCGSH